MKKLSIIIPYYNAAKYTDELLDCLGRQIDSRTEVILVDDGSPEPYTREEEWLSIYRKANGGCASARNFGLDRASGEYVQFIDADDLVPDYFLERLLSSFDKDPDVIDYSWRSLALAEPVHNHVLKSENDRLSNPSVSTRCFKRAFIGDVRFNEKKDSTEDEDFCRRLGVLDPEDGHRHLAITDYMYFYRSNISNSKVKRFKKGLMNTKRVVYYYKHVTKDMSWLLDEIKKEYELNEVWLLTLENEIPELKRYCNVHRPIAIWGHELRGEAYDKFTKIELPIKTDVILYCEYANVVGGITTVLYNLSHYLSQYYDVLILYDKLDKRQADKLGKVARIMQNDLSRDISCDTLILNRLTDKIPPNVAYRKSIQICHACKVKKYGIPTGRDYLVNVSKAAKDSWGEVAKDGIVINNPFYDDSKELFLVSATRMKASDKGENEKRFRILANRLNEAKIPFVWLNFSDKPLADPPMNFINMEARLNIQSFIKRADYLVQLSDEEAYSMSILEALCHNTAVLACPFPSLFEEGFVDGKTGYVIPFDMDFDVNMLLNVPRFEFRYDNQKIVKQWRKLLDKPGFGLRYGSTDSVAAAPSTGAMATYEDGQKMVKIRVVRGFKDRYTGKRIQQGIISLPKSRVEEILATQKENNLKLIEVLA